MTDVMPSYALPGAAMADPVVRPIHELPVATHEQLTGFFGRGGG